MSAISEEKSSRESEMHDAGEDSHAKCRQKERTTHVVVQLNQGEGTTYFAKPNHGVGTTHAANPNLGKIIHLAGVKMEGENPRETVEDEVQAVDETKQENVTTAVEEPEEEGIEEEREEDGGEEETEQKAKANTENHDPEEEVVISLSVVRAKTFWRRSVKIRIRHSFGLSLICVLVFLGIIIGFDLTKFIAKDGSMGPSYEELRNIVEARSGPIVADLFRHYDIDRNTELSSEEFSEGVWPCLIQSMSSAQDTKEFCQMCMSSSCPEKRPASAGF